MSAQTVQHETSDAAELADALREAARLVEALPPFHGTNFPDSISLNASGHFVDAVKALHQAGAAIEVRQYSSNVEAVVDLGRVLLRVYAGAAEVATGKRPVTVTVSEYVLPSVDEIVASAGCRVHEPGDTACGEHPLCPKVA